MCLVTEHVKLKKECQELSDKLVQSIQNLSDSRTKLSVANLEIRKLNNELTDLSIAKSEIETLQNNLEQALNPPVLLPAGTIDIDLMSSILLDKLEEMGDDKAELYLADKNCKVFIKDEVVKFLELDETDKIVYVAETMDCDDSAAELYGKGIPILWTNKHAMNFFVDTENNLWFVEGQTDKISKDIEDWQGWDIRLFMSR